MNTKTKALIVLGLIIIFTITLCTAYYLTPTSNEQKYAGVSTQNLGNITYGTVVKEGPYGNKESDTKIAIIMGVHPQESDAHNAMLNAIKQNSNSLKYSYTIYKVNVTQDPDDYQRGRMNGQLLANKFAVPDIINQKYNLTIDVHSNVGNWEKTRFIFAPVAGSSAESIGKNLSNELPWLSYYVPPNPTSTVYVTEPLINAGIPALVYETFHNDSDSEKYNHANEFLEAVDGLKL
ncbi:hypothetical protein Metbo_1734 [Methanobacterium lacus]|uniref:Uncharacterized protein n=1 Tax=Methanobacterium lacus (strain AL-21) TaxID=877455 RepID=F0T9S9_METLA|nr:hypothetical protein [Methanobacterium lacus]ADZ09958.1 hypothetical protein Metbo_1734 [Methanobacterium lacus]